jgi:hypothetical protein
MVINLSHKLKLKLLNEKEVHIVRHQETYDANHFGKSIKVPGVCWFEISIDLSDDPDLFNECLEWMTKHQTYFKTSHCACKLNIGPFEGLWPTQCNCGTMTVNFLADEVYYGRKNWKDWFIGECHAPEIDN